VFNREKNFYFDPSAEQKRGFKKEKRILFRFGLALF